MDVKEQGSGHDQILHHILLILTTDTMNPSGSSYNPSQDLGSTTPVLSTSDKTEQLTWTNRWSRYIATWKGTATLGIAASGFTLILNLVVLIWALAAKPKQDGFVITNVGSSSTCKHISLGIRLIVNTLSTLILVSSNRCSQFLCSPTREDVDAHHAHGQWLDIGVRSYRNFRAVRGWRMIVAVFLLVTSLPIHLVYNSVQLITYVAQDYVAVTVDPSFDQGLPWDTSRRLPDMNASLASALAEVATSLEHNVTQHTLTPLDLNSCKAIYQSQFQSKWGNLLVVSPELTSIEVNGTWRTSVAALTEAWVASPGIMGNYQWWNSTVYNGHTDRVLHPPNGTSLYAFAANCVVDGDESCAAGGTYTKVAVESCFVQKTLQKSTLSLSIGFLAFTIGANLVKVLTLLVVINKDFRPLATTGEAVSSFLAKPDIHTAGIGPVSVFEVRGGQSSPTWQAFAFNANRRFRLFKAATKFRWWLGVLSLLVPLLAAVVCLYWANAWSSIPSEGNTRTVFTGNDSFTTPAVYRVSNSFTGTALAVNAIQIGLAWSYLAVNDLMTSMLASHEYQSYAAKRKAMRVARPEGQQRDTYFLSLPWKYGLPLVTLWTLLHWQLSIELELVKVQVYNYNGVLDKRRGYQGMVISSFWFTGIVIGVFLIFVGLIVLSFLRYPRGMPLTRSNSILISAACHRGPNETEKAALMPVQYGVLPGVMNDGYECVGFSSLEVGPLIAGRRYSSYVHVDVDRAPELDKKIIEF